VEGTEAKWWTMVSPKRRQELSLGALVGGLIVAGVVTLRAVRRARARRSLR
jgi:LPS O-antigen subunit length determinant protein (WzzB/FepE family)